MYKVDMTLTNKTEMQYMPKKIGGLHFMTLLKHAYVRGLNNGKIQ